MVAGLSVNTKRGLSGSYSVSPTGVVNVFSESFTFPIVLSNDPLASCRITKSIGFLGTAHWVFSFFLTTISHPFCDTVIFSPND